MKTTLREFWDGERPTRYRYCADCGDQCQGVRCIQCYNTHRDAQQTRQTECVDCGKKCRGTRCQACNDVYRVRQREASAARPRRRRPKQLSITERFPIPTPSTDSSPLTPAELDKAVCPSTDWLIFFPDQGQGSSSAPAKRICAGCEIAPRCLAVAIERNEAAGVWGGATVEDRNRIRRRMQRTAVETEGAVA